MDWTFCLSANYVTDVSCCTIDFIAFVFAVNKGHLNFHFIYSQFQTYEANQSRHQVKAQHRSRTALTLNHVALGVGATFLHYTYHPQSDWIFPFLVILMQCSKNTHRGRRAMQFVIKSFKKV